MKHLESLTKLQWLDVMDTRVTDVAMEHLRKFRDLQGLNLSETKVTDAGLERLKGLKKLEIIFLGNTQVTIRAQKTSNRHCQIARFDCRMYLKKCWKRS